MGRIIFVLVVVVLIGGSLEIYTWRGLRSKWNNYPKGIRLTIKTIFLLLLALSVLSVIAFFSFGDLLPKPLRNFSFGFAMINFFTKLALAIPLFVDDLRRLFIWVKRLFRKKEQQFEGKEISRSDFLVKTSLAVAAIPAISFPVGMLIGPYNYTIRRTKLQLANLPASFRGLKIIQISDIHSGSFYDKEAVMRGVEMIREEKPDVLFFTGDLVNDSSNEMDDYIDVFSRLTAPMGVFSVLGNHDYGDYREWSSKEEQAKDHARLRAIQAEMGWRLLLDEHIYLQRGDEKIAVIGVQNWGSGFHQVGDLKKAYEGIDAPVQILLSHDPTHWDEEVRKNFPKINLTLSGHTHGAQMGIETHGFKWSPASLRYDKWAGLYQEGEQYLYVNRGYGFIGYPGRIGIWPEITVIELV
jgi:uncharacterized protein